MFKKPEAIAMYLPQFHNVEENNLWWGEGFTEWRAMDCAKALFEGHKQPKCPQNGYKYDLLQKETMLWQADLMKQYGIYGMAFYHYWFKDGRRILEKPAENLLQWTDVDMPFCFCWANESWVRSWSKLNNANVWAGSFEAKESDGDSDGILLEQQYGEEDAWKMHFAYLLPFFQDKRYIKLENKPVFMIYKSASIPCLKEMLQMWNELAVEEGFAGVYVIGANAGADELAVLDAGLVHEPQATIQRDFLKRFANPARMEVARFLPYEKVCRASLDYRGQQSKCFWGGFVNYDDTPRRGNGGTVIYNGNPEKFKLYLTELLAKNAALGNEYVFINAWNEWGEGMYLEPDATDGAGYLEAFRYAAEHYEEELYKYLQSADGSENEILNNLKSDKERYLTESRLFDKWLGLKEEKRSVTDYFKEKNYKRIAIYGFGALGKHLLNEIMDGDGSVECAYLIDRNAGAIQTNVPVYLPEDDLEPVDVIVVSTVHIYRQIQELLAGRGIDRIVSLKQVIEEC